jgi:hypothetical protein
MTTPTRFDVDIPLEVAREPGRVADQHVAFRFEWRQVGGHIQVKVRVASRTPSAQVNFGRALAGEFHLQPAEWAVLRQTLLAATPPGPVWLLNGRYELVYGAGHPDLAGVEAEHTEHQFIEVVEVFASDA